MDPKNINDDTVDLKEKGNMINYKKEIFQWVVAIFAAVLIALLIRTYIFEPVQVDGQSMEDTLENGQKLILYKLGYRFSEPKRGDIIVLKVKEGIFGDIPILGSLPFFRDNDNFSGEIDYIKRVIGVPGDVIDIKDGYVYINGKKLDEPYAKGLTYKKTLELPITVQKNQVFVLGDNRENSNDSRYASLGCIDYSRIKGKATFRFWPLNKIGYLYKTNK